MIDAIDFHWLVGILEGEGTFLAAPPSRPGQPLLRVSMTDRDVVERVARLLERAVVKLRARREHHKRPYTATMKAAPAVELMTAVYPFMGAKRQREIQRAILSWHGHPPRRRRASGVCDVPDCGALAAKRGLCKRHHDAWWKAHRHGRRSNIAPTEVRSVLLSAAHACDERCDFSWLVGLLEGEGTFSSARTDGHSYPNLQLKMCTEDVVSKVSRLLASPSVTKQPPRREGWSVTFVTSISGSDAAAWMRRLRDHMGRRRTEAIDAALGAYHPIRLVDAPASCVVPGCGEAHRGRGLCHKHYMMWSRDRAMGRDARIVPLR